MTSIEKKTFNIRKIPSYFSTKLNLTRAVKVWRKSNEFCSSNLEKCCSNNKFYVRFLNFWELYASIYYTKRVINVIDAFFVNLKKKIVKKMWSYYVLSSYNLYVSFCFFLQLVTPLVVLNVPTFTILVINKFRKLHWKLKFSASLLTN